MVPFSSFLCKDAFENLLYEKDFIIKCGDQEFHFNKTLLCLVSDVFRTMIQGKLGSEAISGFVEILDTSPDTIKAFQKIVFENKYFVHFCFKGAIKYLSANINKSIVGVSFFKILVFENNLLEGFDSIRRRIQYFNKSRSCF